MSGEMDILQDSYDGLISDEERDAQLAALAEEESMTALPLEPHTEAEEATLAQPDRDPGYGQPEAECRRVHRFSPETGWACRQEMVNGGRTVCGCGAVFFHHRGPGQWSCVRCGRSLARWDQIRRLRGQR